MEMEFHNPKYKQLIHSLNLGHHKQFHLLCVFSNVHVGQHKRHCCRVFTRLQR